MTMSWTVLYTVSTEGNLAMRTTSYHDAVSAQPDIEGKIRARWGADADFKITCMIKGGHEIWLPDEVKYV